MAKGRQQKQKKNFIRCNERIRIPEILLIYEGENLGVMRTSDALAKARAVGLDLVEVSPNSRPPVCQIMDYGKFMFDRQKREKHKTASQQKEKEISFRYVIDDNDLQTKANQIRKFIEKGFKVKVVVKFKAREKAHKEKGFVALEKLIEMLEDVASVEKSPGFEGHNVIARLDKKESKDGPGEDKEEPKKNPKKST
jgi:translation initiation factor IF-3